MLRFAEEFLDGLVRPTVGEREAHRQCGDAAGTRSFRAVRHRAIRHRASPPFAVIGTVRACRLHYPVLTVMDFASEARP